LFRKSKFRKNKWWIRKRKKSGTPFSIMKNFFIKFGSRFCVKRGNLKKPRVTVHYCVSWKRKSYVNISRERGMEREASGECIECSSSSNFGPISEKKSSDFETAITVGQFSSSPRYRVPLRAICIIHSTYK